MPIIGANLILMVVEIISIVFICSLKYLVNDLKQYTRSIAVCTLQNTGENLQIFRHTMREPFRILKKKTPLHFI